MAHSDLYLSPARLMDLTRFYTDEVASGAYPFIDFDPAERWHQRIYRDRRMDVWLISWLPIQSTELHDHGSSAGAFTVLSGRLHEAVVTGGSAHEHERRAGSTIGFGPRYVHDVRNSSASPAVSVHAYSPPLKIMNYYDLSDGRLEPIASVATEDPEPVVEIRRAS
jgi:quercetin dioxygenase-like cupin family protein